jgi:hypothetical protein
MRRPVGGFRQPAQKVQAGPIARPYTLPAPVGGWNAKDSIGNMPPTDAVYMVNFFPRTGDVVQRNGFTSWATGLGGQVNAVFSYNSGASSKLFASSGSNTYDVSAGGAVGAAVISGRSSDHWIHAQYTTDAHPYLWITNDGGDPPYVYDGTSWQQVTGVSAPIALTGVTTTLLSYVAVMKERLWFIERNSMRAWYLAAGAVSGALTEFNLGSVFARGGSLIAMALWPVQGGFGAQDLVVFATDQGELAVYQGTDPASASTFTRVGTYYFGKPVGAKCLQRFGQDLLIMNTEGISPLSQGRFFADIGLGQTLTDKIQQAISDAISLYSGNWGWQMRPFPDQNMLIVNIPIAVGQQQQYVMNTITGAWCSFTSINANAWELWNEQPYFGGAGMVGRFWNGTSDAGSNINGDCKQAFNVFEAPGVQKQWTMMQPIFIVNGTVGIQATFNVDFDDTPPSAPIVSTTSTASAWDVALWDVGMWGSDGFIFKPWYGITALGTYGAVRIKTASQNVVRWQATNIPVTVGNILAG